MPSRRTYLAGLGSDYEWRDNLPAAVLEREAALHLDYFARDIAGRFARARTE